MRLSSFSFRAALAALVTIAAAPAAALAQGSPTQAGTALVNPATNDARIGLKAGKYDAGEAAWNLKLLSASKPSEKFVNGINSDLAFFGPYAIQGNFNGYQIWNISDPAHPTIRTSYYCPASQSDVSVYKNLLIVSSEATSARLDCGGEGVKDTVSAERIRGIRIFDISDLDHPKYVTSVQTCRGSHTHSLLADPKDPANIYIYISGSAPLRSPNELHGCDSATPDKDPNSALMRIEIIKIPVAHPEKAAVVSTARIFQGLKAPPTHGEAATDSIAAAKTLADAREHNGYIVTIFGKQQVLSGGFIKMQLDSLVKARGGTGAPTAADSATLHGALQGVIDKLVGANAGPRDPVVYSQCHDITLYPALGLAGGACEGHGLLLDISHPTQPVRLDAVDDQNFSYWHSATFSNDGKKVLFTDEWGGGGAPKCRSTDPRDWGADAIFTIGANHKLQFQSYYKLPAPQTAEENCVAHNGSLVPVPGRDVMVQAWYQGGISVFDWTDPKHAREIAYFDRGPLDSTRMILGGSWSAYWYNGSIVSSEITRGLDVFALQPSDLLSQNEIDAAKTAKLDYLNVQDQPRYTWPASFSLAGAYLDQLERSSGLAPARVTAAREALSAAQSASGAARRKDLSKLASQLDGDVKSSSDASKVRLLAGAVRALEK
jgi:hypothetical protein